MSDKNSGGFAFPQPSSAIFDRPGMTLRDYFAAKAMQSLINHRAVNDAMVREAYEVADAMIKERSK